MTRALGDFHLKRYGLSATPSVQTAPPPAPGTVRAVVIGSDGLWDTLQFEEARAIVYRPEFVDALDADAATAALLAYGKERARALMGPTYDNIVCAVVYLTVAADPEPAVMDCDRHGPPARNPGGLWYSMSETGGYSASAPRCNGCAHGERDAERAALSWAYLDAYYTHRDDPTPANKAIMDAAHLAKAGGAAAGGGGT